ncbi:prominin-2 isoform A [Alligator mississippiensis]|uniref:Prominin-2 isoform A n=1 Tax=Alligator mississippiensis TaxID=8496 RepID=A0A151LY65_ALLMI|nr:prominin-2 isoform A [Alligator mississippiensis]
MQASQPGGACSSGLALTLVIVLVLLDPVHSQKCAGTPPIILQFVEVGADLQVPALHRVPSNLDPLYSVVRHYLDVVQQNPFPTELLRRALNEPDSVRTSQVMHYEMGYIICAVIAVLFFFAMPVIGLCFCYWRRRQHCGGRIKAYRRSLICQRNFLMLGLLLTSIIILMSVICAFITNQRVKEQMEPGIQAVPFTLRMLRQHIDDIPQGMNSVVEQFEVPKDQIIGDLNTVGRNIGLTIHSQLKDQVYSTLEALKGRAEDLQNSLHHLQILNKTIWTLTLYQGMLAPRLRDHKKSLVSLLDDPRCTSCGSLLETAKHLELGANYSKVPSVEHVLKTLHGLPKGNFPDMIYQANTTFNMIPDVAVEKMAMVVHDLQYEVVRVVEEVQVLADDLSISNHTQLVANALARMENGSRPYLKEIKHYEKYRWIGGIALCSVVLIVVICNFLGLALGAYGLSVRDDPSDYESKGEAGATVLMVGVSLSFFFSWLLILLVFATFFIGGNVQTLVCKNWANQEIYKFVDTPGNLPPSMNITQQLGLNRRLNLTFTYQECKKGMGLWEILEHNDTYNLDDHLRLAKYTTEFEKLLSNFSTHFGEIHILNSVGRRDLETFARSGIDRINYPAFWAEMQNPIVKTSLEGLAVSLEGLQKLQKNSTVAGRLADESQALWQIQNSSVRTQEALVVQLNGSVQFLSEIAAHLQERMRWTMAEIASVETTLPRQAHRILKQEISCFTKKEVGYFTQYLQWVRRTLTKEVASCQPFSTAMDNGRVILCDRIADPWNAFWFSLGACTFFLIPSILFAIKLTKYFRPIRNRLISTGSEETWSSLSPDLTGKVPGLLPGTELFLIHAA